MLVIERTEQQAKAEYERRLDEALAESFPASDPPPWTFGASDPAAVDVVVAHDGASRHRRVLSIVEAGGLATLVPVAILAIGIPVVLVGRWAFGALAWVSAALSK